MNRRDRGVGGHARLAAMRPRREFRPTSVQGHIRMKTAAEIRAAWLAQLHSTTPADRPRAESGVRALYAAAGFAEPQHFFWFDSPCAASWAVAALVPKGHASGSQLLAPGVLSRGETERLERARAAMREQLGLSSWDQVETAVGAPRIGSLQLGMDPRRLFSPAFVEARFGLVDDVSALFAVHGDEDDLARAESHFWGSNRGVLNSGLHCPTTDWLIRQSFFDEQTFSTMADDEHRVGDREPPPLVRAASEIARASGMWWPFDNAAILSDRPSEIHVNERQLPHRADGPAIVFRDGWRVFAWNGKAVPEAWIMQPETVPPREYRGFDPTFKQFVESKGKPTAKAPKRAKPGSILRTALPADPAARLEQLRTYAGGRLPFFDRYQAGEHRQVWSELVSLGPAVREDPHAADALAVAYETMRRVDANVRTLVERLSAMGYVFTPDGPPRGASMLAMGPSGKRIDLDALVRDIGQSGPLGGLGSSLSTLFGKLMNAGGKVAGEAPKAKQGTRRAASRAHVPPGPNAGKEVADFEKEFGTLPLSLRAFYEVVGEVNLIGTHPAIDPEGNSVAPDPLVVYGLDEGIVEYGEEDDDEGDDEGKPSAVTIAPDDLHKANESGGDAYEMAIPDLRADGELLNERHGLTFVEYLRLCFEFAGFPGYEGRARVPAELASLKAGLLEL
jgi:hypothetical protein